MPQAHNRRTSDKTPRKRALLADHPTACLSVRLLSETLASCRLWCKRPKQRTTSVVGIHVALCLIQQEGVTCILPLLRQIPLPVSLKLSSRNSHGKKKI